MRVPAERISEKLGGGLPVFTSEEHDMYQMVSILRAWAHDGVIAFSRHRDFDAGARAFRGNHDG